MSRLRLGLIVLGIFVASLTVEASDAPLGTPDKIEPWSPHPSATPVTSRDEGSEAKFHIKGNGTGICAGGWQFVFDNVEEGKGYHFQAQVRHTGLEFPRDNLVAVVLWDQWDPSQKATGTRPWNYLLPKPVDNSTVDLEATLKAPPGATHLTIRYLLRWSRNGTSTWTAPTVKKVDLPERDPVKICVVNVPKKSHRGPDTRSLTEGTDLPEDVAERVDLWGNLVLKACQQSPQLIVMPEVVISGKDMVEGDMRASRWTPGPPAFDESRWKAIMRTRAMDNQACMAVARNNVQGSCVIDRSGEIVAWNDGTKDMIFATLPAEDGYRLWNGGDFREAIFLLRRPHLYKAYSDASVLGPAGR